MVHRHRARAVQQIRDVAHTLHCSLNTWGGAPVNEWTIKRKGKKAYTHQVVVAVHFVTKVPNPDAGVIPIASNQLGEVALRLQLGLRVVHTICASGIESTAASVSSCLDSLSGQQSDILCWVGGNTRARRHMGTYRGAHARHRNGSRQVSAPQFDRQHLTVPALADYAPSSTNFHRWTEASARGRAGRGQGRQIQRPRKTNDRSSLAS